MGIRVTVCDVDDDQDVQAWREGRVGGFTQIWEAGGIFESPPGTSVHRNRECWEELRPVHSLIHLVLPFLNSATVCYIRLSLLLHLLLLIRRPLTTCRYFLLASVTHSRQPTYLLCSIPDTRSRTRTHPRARPSHPAAYLFPFHLVYTTRTSSSQYSKWNFVRVSLLTFI